MRLLNCHLDVIFLMLSLPFQAFWDSLVDDLKLETPCYTRVARVLKEIRDSFRDLAGSHDVGAAHELLDVDFISEQMSNGAYSWSNCVSLIEGTMSIVCRIQAPKRDAETAELWAPVRLELLNPGDAHAVFCKSLRFVMDRINILRVDAANARLKLVAPVVREYG
jgi:T-complex protein 11